MFSEKSQDDHWSGSQAENKSKKMHCPSMTQLMLIPFQISCSMSGLPRPTEFRWRVRSSKNNVTRLDSLNGSGDDAFSVADSGSESVMTVSPKWQHLSSGSDSNLGELICTAVNSVGETQGEAESCVFRMVKASKLLK